ncbi:hypothetical protein EHS13_17870 [Paenibacillus psychroresistens]|uniref:Uncharacterized protein n=1 Tax=Paenibacillus psychroresistens TaxID=1778678 RepID=A0A6B8RJZ5_9BACL|nr:hypothetical protein [Paenibacillus psychroresistens]QGQ96610.1 hypothetical protein EHS13_17870 [Paenibacillus psychroresistens]
MKSKKFIESWREKREKGKKHYVLRYGILGFGVGLTCLFTIFEIILNASMSSGYLVPRILILPVIGIFLFSYRWESLEIKYAKLISQNRKGN